MQVTSYAPTQTRVKNHDKKEIISALSLVCALDGNKSELGTIYPKETIRTVWYMSKSRSTLTVHCNVFIFTEGKTVSASGRAGGGGYCKKSASFADALTALGIELSEDISGRGMAAVENAMLAIAVHNNQLREQDKGRYTFIQL